MEERRTLGIWIVLALIVGVIIARPTQDSWSRQTWEAWVTEREVAYLIADLQRLEVEVTKLQRRIQENQRERTEVERAIREIDLQIRRASYVCDAGRDSSTRCRSL